MRSSYRRRYHYNITLVMIAVLLMKLIIHPYIHHLRVCYLHGCHVDDTVILGDWNINFTEYSWMVCVQYVRAYVRLGYAHGRIPYIGLSHKWAVVIVTRGAVNTNVCTMWGWLLRMVALDRCRYIRGPVSEPSGTPGVLVLHLVLNGFHICLF